MTGTGNCAGTPILSPLRPTWPTCRPWRPCFSAHRPQKICHLAAQAGVRYSLVNPFAYQKSNLEGFLNLLELAKRFPVGAPGLCLQFQRLCRLDRNAL